MAKLINQLIGQIVRRLDHSGLEQAENRAAVSGTLSVPEIAPAARALAAEGIVLLKNENAALPIRPGETVAVFGRCAWDYFAVGYGSGGDVIPPYVTNLMDGLEAQGVPVNASLAARYAQWRRKKRNIPDQGYWGHWPMHYPEMPLPDSAVEAAARESQLALVVLGRAAGEDRENCLTPGSYYLTREELTLLRQVTKAFDRVCVILDCGNIIDMGWTAEFGDRLNAIVYAWQGGMESGHALAEVLTGAVNPSGHLPDTIAVRYQDYPSADHFGGKDFNVYAEDVFVGYRYFETFAPERVLYPFGFGLSYTTFALEATAEAKGNAVSVTVTAENTGSVAGKAVAQLYLSLPGGQLGQPRKVLCGFAKTALLAPGARQKLEFSLNLADFAAYDDGGYTGHRSCYVLEGGCYRLSVGQNARDTVEILALQKGGLEVVRRCREAAAVQPGHGFQRMVCRDGALAWEPVPTAQGSLKQEILAQLPLPQPQPVRTFTFAELAAGACTPLQFAAQLTPEELADITQGQGKMNSSFGVSGNAGAFGGVTEVLRQRGIPAAITTDGPAGIRIRRTTSLLPCGTALASTFNLRGVEALYHLVGKEMNGFDVDMLLAPGMNLHRNPLCGRNFEYFSEDPLLTGRMGAAVVRGLQSAGVSACPKHFACNNQETNRNRNDSRLSERALRELYLKGFEIMVREAKPWAIMTSYNLVNGVWSHYNYHLATAILRREWGFDGVVITDWWMQRAVSPEFPQLRDNAYRLRAQVDVLMPGELENPNVPRRSKPVPDAGLAASLTAPDGLTMAEAQRSAANVLQFLVRRANARRARAANQAFDEVNP